MLQKLEYNPHEVKFLSWNKTMWEKLWDDWEYLRAPLHDRDFADYEAWKIMFEKMIPYFTDEILHWASSLWGAFILKYLWENDWILDPKSGKKIKIKKLFLIAAAIEDTKYEVLGSFSFDIEQVYTRVSRWSQEIFIYHSLDDHIVPYEQSLKLNSFFPEATFREFHDRGHFYLEAEFPELVEDIKN
jgi:predicted alpha/beta hydrolase family esterase